METVDGVEMVSPERSAIAVEMRPGSRMGPVVVPVATVATPGIQATGLTGERVAK